MKEATGELNITVITIIAIAAVGMIFYVFVWPTIQKSIADNTCKSYGNGYHAVKGDTVDSTTGATVSKWLCCPDGVESGSQCYTSD